MASLQIFKLERLLVSSKVKLQLISRAFSGARPKIIGLEVSERTRNTYRLYCILYIHRFVVVQSDQKC